MKRPGDMIGGQQFGETLDLSPMTKSEHIFLVAAGACPRRRNRGRIRSIFVDQRHRIIERRASAEEIIGHEMAVVTSGCGDAHKRNECRVNHERNCNPRGQLIECAQPEGRMSEVFVSYKAEDRARVQPLVEALSGEGLAVWWDAHIGGGEEWRDEIAGHLDAASCVIVVWSKRSTGKEGRFVREEATRALKRGTYLPILIDKVEPPLGFGETQALPLLAWKGNRSHPQYAAIARSAKAMAAGEHHHVPSAPPTQGIARRPLLVGGAAALGLAGIGGWFMLRPAEAKANSIAVLPFANLSGDPAQDYFSDGMAEELRSALSRIAGLKVVARTSSEMLRDSDIKAAAERLGVQHILSGSVRRSPSTIRVNAQLIDGGDGLERWSRSFDKAAGDLLEIQTSIAENVAQALSVELGGKGRETLTLGGTSNAAALDLYLRSSPGQQADSKEALDKSLGLLNAAVALDPDFAQAHGRKAFILVLLSGVYALSAAEAQQGYRDAMAAVNRAIAIEPRLAVAYATRAAIQRDQLNIGAALVDLAKADSLPGDDAHTLRIHAMTLGQSRRFAEARSRVAHAKSLDPLNPVSFEVEAIIHSVARDYPAAIASARQSLRLRQDRLQVKRVLANSLLFLGRTAEAQAEYRKFDPTDYRRLLGEAAIAARAGDRSAALAKLAAMEQRYGDAALYQYGEIYAQLGMKDEALGALRRALATRDPGMAFIRVDPLLDPLRGDPRFAAIVREMNFPGA